MQRVATGYRHTSTVAMKRQQAFTKLDFFKTRLLFKTLVLMAFVVFLSLFYIWSQAQIVSYGYQINELKKHQATLKNQNKLLKMELSLLKSPGRLHKITKKKLNMHPPQVDQVIRVE